MGCLLSLRESWSCFGQNFMTPISIFRGTVVARGRGYWGGERYPTALAGSLPRSGEDESTWTLRRKRKPLCDLTSGHFYTPGLLKESVWLFLSTVISPPIGQSGGDKFEISQNAKSPLEKKQRTSYFLAVEFPPRKRPVFAERQFCFYLFIFTV